MFSRWKNPGQPRRFPGKGTRIENDRAGKPVVTGTGVADRAAALKELLAMKFQRHLAVEYESEPENPVSGVEKPLAYVRKVFRSM